jgi:mannose-6-phosphate isomerase-like protein (cupin superfamily)
MKYFADNVEKITEENAAFRKVLYTGPQSQLVAMSLKSGEEIGMEDHDGHDQFIRIEHGKAKFHIAGDEFEGGDGFAVVIPSGAAHNVTNIGDNDLKIYTLYAPAEHPDGTLHQTKEEADAAEHSH